jgi:hypothetical protein
MRWEGEERGRGVKGGAGGREEKWPKQCMHIWIKEILKIAKNKKIKSTRKIVKHCGLPMPYAQRFWSGSLGWDPGISLPNKYAPSGLDAGGPGITFWKALLLGKTLYFLTLDNIFHQLSPSYCSLVLVWHCPNCPLYNFANLLAIPLDIPVPLPLLHLGMCQKALSF